MPEADPPRAIIELPERISNRISSLGTEVKAVIEKAIQKLKTVMPERISFRYMSRVPNRDILSDYERAQSVSFITRYQHLPEKITPQLVLDEQDQWHIGNLWDLRHALNDFRPLIQNQSDSVYYQRIHSTWSQMLRREDSTEGTTIQVIDITGKDVTDVYVTWLGERNRAIRTILGGLDYGYLYNGFLQHSDPELSTRLFQDYISGELNYILWKHTLPLGTLLSLLKPYHTLMWQLTFPTLGPL